MPRLSLVRSLIAVTILGFCRVITNAQGNLLPIEFKSEGSQISFSLRKEFLPAISHIGLNVFTPEVKKVHEQFSPADQPLVWQVKEMSRYTEGDTFLYLCVVFLKPLKGDPYLLPGRIMQSGKKLEFALLAERPNNLLGPGPVEFHKSMTEAMPNNGAAWFSYGLAISEQQRDSMGFFAITLAPPPPPPAAPPPSAGRVVIKEIPVPKEEQKQIDEEEKQWKAKKDALQKDMKIAQPAFLKAAELADDCQIKDTAMAYLAAIAREFDDVEQERQWLFKRIESPCATNSVKAESYYALGVKQWSCAWELTGKYANKKAADPFHFRAITNPADKQKLDNCITTAAELVEKAIEADPKFPDALFYKSLIYREKQKVTANPAERKRLNDEAAKLSARGVELMKQAENSPIK